MCEKKRGKLWQKERGLDDASSLDKKIQQRSMLLLLDQIPGSHLQIIVTGIVRECGLHRCSKVLCTGAACGKFLELHKDLDDISQKVLTDSLRSMEMDGLVVRTVFPEVPPRVEYALSSLGESMQPIIKSMETWGLRTKAELYPERKNKNKMPRLLSVQDRKQSGHSRIIRWGQSSSLPCSQPRAR